MTTIETQAGEHVESMITMSNRPVHRPDVLQEVFLAGAQARQPEIDDLVAALKFYADKNNWYRDEEGWRHDMIRQDLDDETLTIWDGRFSGRRAREALKKHEAKNG